MASRRDALGWFLAIKISKLSDKSGISNLTLDLTLGGAFHVRHFLVRNNMTTEDEADYWRDRAMTAENRLNNLTDDDIRHWLVESAKSPKELRWEAAVEERLPDWGLPGDIRYRKSDGVAWVCGIAWTEFVRASK